MSTLWPTEMSATSFPSAFKQVKQSYFVITFSKVAKGFLDMHLQSKVTQSVQ